MTHPRHSNREMHRGIVVSSIGYPRSESDTLHPGADLTCISAPELAQTLKLHKFCARATLTLNWCIACGVTVAWLAGLLILAHTSEAADVPHSTQVAVLILCIAAYAACFCLWRCYESTLRNIRALQWQLGRMNVNDRRVRRAWTQYVEFSDQLPPPAEWPATNHPSSARQTPVAKASEDGKVVHLDAYR